LRIWHFFAALKDDCASILRGCCCVPVKVRQNNGLVQWQSIDPEAIIAIRSRYLSAIGMLHSHIVVRWHCITRISEI
jgi:hypothetical protein